MSKDLNIIKKYDSADKEEFKRPNHTDFMTSSELKAKTFSGIRINSISNNQELWLAGDILISMPLNRVAQFWDAAYAAALGCNEVQTISQKGN